MVVHNYRELMLMRHLVWLLNRQSLYGLKQALRAWFKRFASYITRVGFQHSRYYYFSTSGIIYDRFSRTPIDTESKLGVDSDSVSDLTLYRSLAGSLQYLTFTRPDISYAVQQVFLHMHDPRESHLSALKQISRQPTFSCSNAEAEYRGVANAVAETCWLRNLLRELHNPLSSATLVYCDNVSAVYLSWCCSNE
uniref:Ribonuclease H-like domain-containing protein n=1 Tax=Tanacetum cinerariifolium TaxID=118510 RepID=A0A699HT86_TANCI|nr:ribonuclease H-like domain-containing protein [Tanacetum cinerariifolium]